MLLNYVPSSFVVLKWNNEKRVGVVDAENSELLSVT